MHPVTIVLTFPKMAQLKNGSLDPQNPETFDTQHALVGYLMLTVVSVVLSFLPMPSQGSQAKELRFDTSGYLDSGSFHSDPVDYKATYNPLDPISLDTPGIRGGYNHQAT